MKLLKKVNAIFDRTITFLAFISGILLIYVMVSTDMEVVLRSLGHPTIWIVEVASYCLLFITFLAAAWLLREEGHVSLEIVFDRLGPRAQTFFNIITSILGTIICLIITWYGLKVTWEHFRQGIFVAHELRTPMFIILAAIPVGSFLLFIQFIRRTYGYVRELGSARQAKKADTEVTIA